MNDSYVFEIKPLVSKIHHTGDLEESIESAVTTIGGFENSIDIGDKILLKPNFNTADPPPASSDMEALRAVIRLLYKYGAKKVILGESSTLLASTRRVMEKIGAIKVAKEEDVEIAVFGDKGWKKIPVKKVFLNSVELAREVFDVDKLVYLCCLKTHNLAKFSCSLKHIVGLIKPFSRIGWHLHGLEHKIAEANTVIHPNLLILDARRCFIAGGPNQGKIAKPDLILASRNRVALDVEGIKIIKSYDGNSLKRDPWNYAQIRSAVELGLGPKNSNEYTAISK
jgi:uncharacterized protein (DUF362 family)